MALTEAKPREMRSLGEVEYDVKDAAIIFEGAICCYDANDELLPGADTAGLKFAGIHRHPTVDNTDDGEQCRVDPLTPYHAFGSGFAAGDRGEPIYVIDDDTVSKTSTHGVWGGNIEEVLSSEEVVVMPPRAVELRLSELTFSAQEVADLAAAGIADGDIAALTFSASPTQGECEALRDKCALVLDEVLALRTAVTAIITGQKTLTLFCDPS